MSKIENQLHRLGLSLPEPVAPIAQYIPYVIVENLVFISGQISIWDASIKYTGPVNAASIEIGKQAAQLCALNILAQLKAACLHDLDQVQSCVRLGGFINCAPDFTQHAQVMNGASEIIQKVLGEAGRHTRTSVGCSSLPQNAMVEVDAIFTLI